MQRVLTRQRWRRPAAAVRAAARTATVLTATALMVTAGAIAATAAFVAPAQAQEPAPADCLTAEYAANTWNTSQDNGGFITRITLSNVCEETVRGWTVRLTLPPGHELASGWAATWTSAGDIVTGTATSWNDELRPDRSVIIGFIGSFAGAYQDPLTCTINASACEGYDTGTGENEPPAVSLSSDTSSFSFACPITFTAQANDPDGAVDRVEFYVNEELVGTADSAPYELEVVPGGALWQTNENVVVARAYDDGEPPLSTDSEPVIVRFFPPPPALFLVACDSSVELEPGGSETVRFVNACLSPQEIELTVTGDPGITVAPESFAMGSFQVVTITAAPGSAGATATINAHGGCTPAPVEVSVTGESDDNLPPEVEITSPADGASFAYPCRATLSATAHDPDGAVDRVEFYVNDELVVSDDTAPYEVELSHGAFDNVAYARAFDNGDPALSADSEPVSFTFVPPPPAPPGGTTTPPILSCIDSLEVEEGGSRVVTYSNICGVPGEWTITMIVDGDPAVTVDPETFVTQGGRDLTISAAAGSAGATATVSAQGGCTSASVEVTVVPAAQPGTP